MSPLVVGAKVEDNLLTNGMTIVNSFVEQPYHFPHTMTLFQPSKDRYDDPNLAKDDNGITPFITWYKNHNRKTVVSQLGEYGENISNLTCLGSGSYVLELATYSPTNLVLELGDDKYDVPFNTDKFREIRAEAHCRALQPRRNRRQSCPCDRALPPFYSRSAESSAWQSIALPGYAYELRKRNILPC